MNSSRFVASDMRRISSSINWHCPVVNKSTKGSHHPHLTTFHHTCWSYWTVTLTYFQWCRIFGCVATCTTFWVFWWLFCRWSMCDDMDNLSSTTNEYNNIFTHVGVRVHDIFLFLVDWMQIAFIQLCGIIHHQKQHIYHKFYIVGVCSDAR